MKRLFRNKNFIQILAIIIVAITVLIGLTGCTERDATIVSRNVSKEADQFRVYRRIVFINLRSDTYLFELKGFCSLADNESYELEVTCMVGPNEYQKHFLRKSNETTYVVEQLDSSNVSKYKYEIVFKPTSIIPITIDIE